MHLMEMKKIWYQWIKAQAYRTGAANFFFPTNFLCGLLGKKTDVGKKTHEY